MTDYTQKADRDALRSIRDGILPALMHSTGNEERKNRWREAMGISTEEQRQLIRLLNAMPDALDACDALEERLLGADEEIVEGIEREHALEARAKAAEAHVRNHHLEPCVSCAATESAANQRQHRPDCVAGEGQTHWYACEERIAALERERDEALRLAGTMSSLRDQGELSYDRAQERIAALVEALREAIDHMHDEYGCCPCRADQVAAEARLRAALGDKP